MTFPESVPMRVTSEKYGSVILQAFSTQEARLLATWQWGVDLSREELKSLKVEVSSQALEKFKEELK